MGLESGARSSECGFWLCTEGTHFPTYKKEDQNMTLGIVFARAFRQLMCRSGHRAEGSGEVEGREN